MKETNSNTSSSTNSNTNSSQVKRFRLLLPISLSTTMGKAAQLSLQDRRDPRLTYLTIMTNSSSLIKIRKEKEIWALQALAR
jgi:hypothetical protein